jgi:hypothetical protein
MSRYRFTKQKIDKDTGSRVYGTTIYPKIPLEDTDIFIHSIEGDRLDLLAHKYYGDETLWWIIAKANSLRNGKFALKAGQQLRIPQGIEQILIAFRAINS